MLLVIPQILPREEALALGAEIAAADWVDGNATSGVLAAQAKRNRQIPERSPVAEAAQRRVQAALAASEIFLSAALPKRVYPPLFNRYAEGEQFANHIDNAIRLDPVSGSQMRTDLSATLFLSEGYVGGELIIEGEFGGTAHKHAAGDMILYPSSSIHRVLPVTKGERIASFFWIESLVAEGAAREILFDLDQSVQNLTAAGADQADILRLTKSYHNLVRRWAG